MLIYLKQQGYILFIVIIFMQILTLTAMTELFVIHSQTKINRHRLEQKINLINMHDLLQRIYHLPLTSFLCLISPIPTDFLIKKPLSWWQKEACQQQENNLNYFFVVEKIGEQPCAIYKNQLFNIEFYRITLRSEAPYQVFLQSTLAIANHRSPRCTEKPYPVTMGQQILREI